MPILFEDRSVAPRRSVSWSRPSPPRLLLLLVVIMLSPLGLVTPQPVAAAGPALPCSTSGTWTPGEVTVYWFDVEQGDSQLIVGPSGKTLLIDLGETAFNTTGANTKATAVAAKIRAICGTGSSPVALDYVLLSHHHLDHIGYAANPSDTSTYGNGLYQLLTPAGLGFTVGTLLDRDAGTWSDTNGNGQCEVGTSTSPSTEIAWHNAGTTSQTARRLICWLYGPAGQADRAHIAGRVVTLTNSAPWPALDLGAGVTATIVNANGKDTLQADGVTPVSGDHTTLGVPPSENDYSVAVKLSYGDWTYATAGDSDGEYNTSSFGYTYNDVEATLAPRFGNVETMRANHHGSGHSSNAAYLAALRPETAIFSCGANSYGHPSNRVLTDLRALPNERGTGADIYLTNRPCDPYQADGVTATDYTGTLNTNGDVVLRTTSAGAGYTISYDAGTRAYSAYGATPPPAATPAQVVINEYLMAPQSGTTEWIELYNPTTSAIDLSGLYLDDVAGGGGAPKQLPAGTTIPPQGYYVLAFASGFLNNTGTEAVRYLAISGGVETVYDATTYTLGSTHYDKVFHRTGDGGSWCTVISTNATSGAANPATCP